MFGLITTHGHQSTRTYCVMGWTRIQGGISDYFLGLSNLSKLHCLFPDLQGIPLHLVSPPVTDFVS